jgi:hypothetical protein
MFERWLEYLDDVKQKVKGDEHAQALQQLADELASVRCVGEEGVAEEKERRREQAKRIVYRLLHSQLAHAFDSYAYRVLEVRRQRETCTRVVLRMQHVALAGAFDLFIGTMGQLKAHWQMVEKAIHLAIGRWRTLAMATAMWAWMQLVAQERKAEVLEQARNQLSGLHQARYQLSGMSDMSDMNAGNALQMNVANLSLLEKVEKALGDVKDWESHLRTSRQKYRQEMQQKISNWSVQTLEPFR